MNPEVVASELEELGLSPDDVGALFLVPGAVVAWADNHADMNELETIASRHAHADCGEDMICVSEEARQIIYYHFVYQYPDKYMLEKACRIIHGLIKSCSTEEERNRIRKFIADVCVDVARSSGDGLLGFLNRIDPNEKQVISNFTHNIELRKSSEAAEILQELGL